MLKANEYPNVWQFSDEQPSPPKDYPTSNRVEKFMETFISYQCFSKIYVWGDTLSDQMAYKVDEANGYRVIDTVFEANKLSYLLARLSKYEHFSVMYVSQVPDQFLRKILSFGHYGKPDNIGIGSKKRDDPLGKGYSHVLDFLESDVFKDGDRIFTFSADAQFLYEIFR